MLAGLEKEREYREGVVKLMVLPGEIVVNQSCLNKSSRPRRIFKKCLFN